MIALRSTREKLNGTINELERLGLIKTEYVDDLVVLELCESGQDVAYGRSTAEGVLRPRPDCHYRDAT